LALTCVLNDFERIRHAPLSAGTLLGAAGIKKRPSLNYDTQQLKLYCLKDGLLTLISEK
jgi:hypothetical protein